MRSRIISAPFRPYICPSCIRSLKLRARRYATETSTPDLYDVVCVGGGPAGLSLLTALRSSPKTSSLRLALVESQSLSPSREWTLPPDQFSNRASSLTPASVSFLSQTGAWLHIDQSRAQPYHHMQVWDGVWDTSRISFSSPSPGGPIATMTENPNLVRGLLRRLEELPPVSVFDKTSVSSITLGPPVPPSPTELDLSSYPHVNLSDSRTLTTRLLIGADGLNSPVRKFVGIPSRGWDYNRHGVVATVKLAPEDLETRTTDKATAFQRFLPNGPIALLALPDGYATLVWSTTPAEATRLKALSEEDFAAMINAAFRLSVVDLDYMSHLQSGQVSELEWRLFHTTLPSPSQLPRPITNIQRNSTASFPLRLRHSDAYTADRVALIGDAAHTIHPLAGQGLNMGLGDVESLVGCIEYAVEHGMDLGKAQALERYGRERWMANQRMGGVVDKLHWLYSVRNGPVVGLRALGLSAVDKLGPLKDFLMGQARGTAQKVSGRGWLEGLMAQAQGLGGR